MKLSQEDQVKFAREILALESSITDSEELTHLKKVVSLFNFWAGARNSVASNLDEYMYEVVAIANGEEDTGWKDEFRKKLDRAMNYREQDTN